MKFGHSPASADSRRAVVIYYKRMYVHRVLVNRLSLSRNKSEVTCRLTDRLDITIAVDWDFKPNKPMCTPIFSDGYSFPSLTVYMSRDM